METTGTESEQPMILSNLALRGSAPLENCDSRFFEA